MVKLHIDVSWTSNVTCGKFERRHDSNINVMVICCEGPKSWWSHFLVVPVFQGHCLSGISDLVMVEFCINNERFGSPTLTDEMALTLVREVTDTDRRSTVGDTAVMCDLKTITV